jgi:hypothetical protein
MVIMGILEMVIMVILEMVIMGILVIIMESTRQIEAMEEIPM